MFLDDIKDEKKLHHTNGEKAGFLLITHNRHANNTAQLNNITRLLSYHTVNSVEVFYFIPYVVEFSVFCYSYLFLYSFNATFDILFQIHMMSDPCTVLINDVCFGLTSTDILFHLGAEEAASL